VLHRVSNFRFDALNRPVALTTAKDEIGSGGEVHSGIALASILPPSRVNILALR
jgi:hypothetical protein